MTEEDDDLDGALRAPLDDGDRRPADAGIDPHAAVALFSLGVTAGMLLLLIGFTLVPEPRDRATEEFEAVRAFAQSHFVRPVDAEGLTERALHGMLDGLDPYSRYHDRADAERARREIDGDFRGIGVVFKPPITDAQVLFPVDGSPAAEAGIKVGDRILSVDGESTVGLAGDELRARLAPRGRELVTLGLEGLDGRAREVQVAPRILLDPTVRHVQMVADAPGVGYLTVRSFTNQTADEFDGAVQALRRRGARALVIDLRFNYGGVLDAAIQMAGRFVDTGVIVSSEGRLSAEVHRADEVDPLYLGMGVVVLVDGDSASASEVLAGALQDHRVAVVVGEPTYGKGMLQTTRSFPSFGTRAKVTSAYFYSPSHRNFERTSEPGRDYGILPDVQVAVDDDLRYALHTWIARYDPPIGALAEMAAWEAATDDDILPEEPADPQLGVALDLLRGTRPGPRPLDPLR